MKKYLIIIASVVLMGAADPGGCVMPDAASIKTICTALVGPIRYNSTKPVSLRYAGKVLVPDLKQRNQIWDGLHCSSVV